MPITIASFGQRPIDDPDVFNVTSQGTTWAKNLSPFLLGPVKLWGSLVSKNVENAWQYLKVYDEHIDPFQVGPNKLWWEWMQQGIAQSQAVRYPKGRGAKPRYSYWDGNNYDYIVARKRIYIPLYTAAVRANRAWPRLQQAYADDLNLTLWDFDGYDHQALGYSWEDVIEDRSRSLGHGFVLAMMLEGYL
jgi:hypothetical protein